eukprot:TRINITY_DN1984_c0_g1_i16.p1 TRINITY_DN1984_c0_g1~~TRINITY_DN1984_c0_g1_i16.p1  ORF type:complete len:244 (+),score=67.51 TRINITY_DN1984_c0_g1_i16:816-1547(+)
MYFLRGSLPWQGLKAKNKQEKYDAIKEKKMSTTVESLCKDYPKEFTIYLNECRKLRFDEKPDYGLLRKLFKDLFQEKGYEYDYIYDWMLQKQGGKQPTVSEQKPFVEDGVVQNGDDKREDMKDKAREELKGPANKSGTKFVVHKQPVRIVKDSANFSKTATAGTKPQSKFPYQNFIKSSAPAPKIITTDPKVVFGFISRHTRASLFAILILTSNSCIFAHTLSMRGFGAVSYTHLTLPTNREV